MRYADGPTAEVEVLVAAPTERIWALVSDVDVPARFSTELQGAEWLDGPGGRAPAVGDRFVGRSHHDAIGSWETTCVLTVVEPGRSFGWAVGEAANPSASWRFDLEPQRTDAGDERILLRQSVRLGPAPSGLTPAIEAMPDKEERIIARRLGEHRANMLVVLEGIKGLAEAPAT